MEMNNMAMRSQLYEWKQLATASIENVQSSIFIGGTGNNITKPAETTATQFVVIEQVASTPSNPTSWTTGATSVRNFMQIRINTTDYFLDPDNKPNDGIPGAASPYPRTVAFQPAFTLYPDVYVLPGQVWDALITGRGTGQAVGEALSEAFVKYTLYDGPDALIANKLLELGISVSPANVDWYKRSLISQQSAASMAPTA
jgi:hypothetical protein